jgi:hypothetical protein
MIVDGFSQSYAPAAMFTGLLAAHERPARSQAHTPLETARPPSGLEENAASKSANDQQVIDRQLIEKRITTTYEALGGKSDFARTFRSENMEHYTDIDKKVSAMRRHVEITVRLALPDETRGIDYEVRV